MASSVLIVYATVTGNAEDVAERIGREAQRRGYSPTVLSSHVLARQVDTLSRWPVVLWVVSTSGQGSPPPAFRALWKTLLRRSLPPTLLADQASAVFGLGDSGYTHYNMTAKKLYRRLEGLGASMLVPGAGLGDDRVSGGYQRALDPWLTAVWMALQTRLPPRGGLCDIAASDRYSSPSLRWLVEVLPRAPSEESAAYEGIEDTGLRALRASASFSALEAAALLVCGIEGENDDSATRRRRGSCVEPLAATVRCNARLTAEGHWQDVRHMELVVDGGVAYDPGDLACVLPQQPTAAIDELIKMTGVTSTAWVRVSAANAGPAGATRCFPLWDLVMGVMDVSSVSPRRLFFEVLRDVTKDEHERERLEYLCSADGMDDLAIYNGQERRTVLEVLRDFPGARPTLSWLLTAVPRLQPRAFSISSSPLAHPDAVHLTVAVVDWVTPYRRKRHGLCSTWLSERPEGAAIHFWTEKGDLQYPEDPGAPLILVGPGTGVAPARSFLQHRAALAASGAEVGPAVLFFGCRNRGMDYLYRGEWEALKAAGVLLDVHLAASRDQPHKVYVQDVIRANGIGVLRLLQSGAYIFITGSAEKMPAAVVEALEAVLKEHGEMPATEAKQLLKRWESTRRCQIEAWT